MARALPKALLDGYVDPLPIRSRGAFQLVSARRGDGGGCVLVLPGANADGRLVAAAFDDIERIHARIDHPQVPRVSRRTEVEGVPLLELDCDATMDGEDIIRCVADSGRKLPYDAADGFIRDLRIALQAAHAATDPRTGRPVCLGRISLRNILFNTSGRSFLVGFGRNFPLERESGALDGETVCFAAPEVTNGVAPSPMGDYLALLLFMRSFASYVESLEPLRAILAGDVNLLDGELFKLLTWVELRVFAAPASLRASMDEAIRVADRIRVLLKRQPDAARFERFVAEIVHAGETPSDVESDGRPAGGDDALHLLVGPDTEWIAGPDETRHRLGRALRLIVQELVARHRTGRPPLTVSDLCDVGWPGERPIAQAGANRVHVELNRLRRMGLRELLERTSDGYRLVPGVRVVDQPARGLVDKLLGRSEVR